MAVNPATSNSSTSGGYSPDVRFIFAAISSETMLTTNSRVVWMLRSVSLRCSPAARGPGQKQISVGFELMPVKKLNGAKLRMPSLLMVETSAIGRGTIEPIKSL